jgi:predicted DNA-binding protein
MQDPARPGKTGNRMPSFSLRLPPELREELERLAAEDRRPLAAYVKLVLEEHVRAKEKNKKKS